MALCYALVFTCFTYFNFSYLGDGPNGRMSHPDRHRRIIVRFNFVLILDLGFGVVEVRVLAFTSSTKPTAYIFMSAGSLFFIAEIAQVMTKTRRFDSPNSSNRVNSNWGRAQSIEERGRDGGKGENRLEELRSQGWIFRERIESRRLGCLSYKN
jgi:hypothetical protein